MFVYSPDVDNDNNAELANKYGMREPTITKWKKDADSQWSVWHEQCDDVDSDCDLEPSSHTMSSMCFLCL